jgi:hypothetical protein
MNAPEKKHPCPDCRRCLWCAEERCRLCLRSTGNCRKKLSMAEQIALFERLNGSNSPDSANCAQTILREKGQG